MFKNWLRNRLYNFLMSNEPCKEPQLSTACHGSVPRLDYSHDGVINIRIFGATGGTVIEVGRYDRKLDQNKTGVYVVPESEDFGSELSKIVTMEQLKNF